jgi:hypothetical protein
MTRTSWSIKELRTLLSTVPREWGPVEEFVGSMLARLESSLEERPVNVEMPDDLLAHVYALERLLIPASWAFRRPRETQTA